MDRRRFVVVTAGAIVSTSAFGCASLLTVQVTPVDGRVRIPLRNFPQLETPGGSLRVQPTGHPSPVMVMALEDGEYAALSSVCTHLECVVNIEGERIVCPCHGSQFALDGQVLTGPAERPLERYASAVDETGELVIDLERTA